MPQQLIALHAGGANGHLNMRLVSWLTIEVNQAREGRFTSLNTRVPVGSGTRLTRDRLERHSCRVCGQPQTCACDRVCPIRFLREQREESAIEKRVFLKANLPRHTETHISPE